MTFTASANCILYAGGEVIFCEKNQKTGLMDLDQLEQLIKIHHDCKGVIPVNYAATPQTSSGIEIVDVQAYSTNYIFH